ncbi:MAG: hypothetical protein MK074_01505 [Phycisphaerales bacterium]|nr:hypothetical protein [Phycisphaerales bacterium]
MITKADLRGPLGLSLAALAVMAVIAVWLIVPLGRSALHLGGGDAPDAQRHARMLESHATLDRTDRNRVHGRSFFFDPAQPPRPAPPEPSGACCLSETECETMTRSACAQAGGTFKGANRSCSDDLCKPPPVVAPPPSIPRGPTRYGGPDLMMVWGSDAIFKDSGDLIIIPLGHSLEDIEVIAIDAPRTVTVNWNGGGPFELDLYPADELPSANSAVTGALLDGRDRPHVDEQRPARTHATNTP